MMSRSFRVCWHSLGSPTHDRGKLYRFVDFASTDFGRRFYLLRSP